MKFLVLNEELTALEERLAQTSDAYEQLFLAVEIAWHLRRRDSKRSLWFANLAKKLFSLAELPECLSLTLSARLDLVDAEAKRLSADLDMARKKAQMALAVFTKLSDHIGCSDAHWLLATIAIDHGDVVQDDVEFRKAAEEAQESGDALRVDMAEAALLIKLSHCSKDDYARGFPEVDPLMHPGLKTLLASIHGTLAFYKDDYVEAAKWFLEAQATAEISGQLDRMLLALANVGVCFSRLNDAESALEWLNRSLEIARAKGWPKFLGWVLTEVAEIYRQLGQHQAASDLLGEALNVPQSLKQSRSYAITIALLGQISTEQADYDTALKSSKMLQKTSAAAADPNLCIQANIWSAKAWAGLRDINKALTAIKDALVLVQHNNSSVFRIIIFQLLAQLHAEHEIEPPVDMVAPSAALHYLIQALEVAASIEGYTVPSDLLDSLAAEYAKVGDHAKAYTTSLQAIAARQKTASREAVNRAIAAQIKHQTESARSQAEHHRQLAEAEARRSEALERMNTTLEHLGTIGQELTRHRDIAVVCETLNRHVHGLLDAYHFAVYLLIEDGIELDCVFGMEAGQALPALRVRVDDPLSYSARCVRERCEIIEAELPRQGSQNLIPGTQAPGSAMFAPLCVGDRILGVMSIQSPGKHAYAERERLIFRTLCAYGAIALDNASAYRQLERAMTDLKTAQQQLVFQEKMASVGTLTAGVAHEINNPANFAHVGAQVLQMELERFRTVLLVMAGENASQTILTKLNRNIDDLLSQISIILEGTTSIRNLVRDLRTFSRLDEAEKKAVSITSGLESAVKLVRMQYAKYVEIRCDLQAAPVIECWPAKLNQVFLNLIINACQAIQAKQREAGPQTPGVLYIRSRLEDGWVVLEFEDNGCGMSPQVQERIFEPFYTTKAVGEGTGLGLSISYGIIEKHQGKITVYSQEKEGSCFTIRLPLHTH